METNNSAINEIIALYGHTTSSHLDFKISDSLLEYIFAINELEYPNIEGVIIPYITKKEMIKRAKYFLDSLISVQNIKYIGDDEYKELLSNNSNANISEFITTYNLAYKLINPFTLPIKFCEEDYLAGLLNTRYILAKEEALSYKILHFINIVFSNINLSKYITDIGVSCYIHEIIHTQTNYEKDMIEDLSNTEIINIFFELLYAYNSNPNSYTILIINRINQLLFSFREIYLTKENEYEYAMNVKYLISLTKAFNLLDKYLNSNNNIKKEIINVIQNIIDNKYTLEEGLNRIEILNNNSLDSNIVRRLILK